MFNSMHGDDFQNTLVMMTIRQEKGFGMHVTLSREKNDEQRLEKNRSSVLHR